MQVHLRPIITRIASIVSFSSVQFSSFHLFSLSLIHTGTYAHSKMNKMMPMWIENLEKLVLFFKKKIHSLSHFPCSCCVCRSLKLIHLFIFSYAKSFLFSFLFLFNFPVSFLSCILPVSLLCTKRTHTHTHLINQCA